MLDEYNLAKQRFREIWGYEKFRPPQGEIINTLLQGKDALVVLPTGGGKSICFQLPALLQRGLTIVVSPLVALMENQVAQLQELGLPGALLHGEISSSQRKTTLEAIARQKLSLLYLSPETLLNPRVWKILATPEIEIRAIVIDEVHCLTQWGTSFRPAYRRLGAVRRSLLKTKPPKTKIAIAAFTATADPQSQREICRALELKQPETFLVNPWRSNLSLNIQTVWTPKGRKQRLLKFIRSHQQQSGLVYVRSRRDSQILTQWLQSNDYMVAAYHAGLIPQERRKIEKAWISGELQFVVCTSAFGMGIDKKDCRFVVHYHPPELLAEYIQEVGRAGRDGKPARALTLISEPTGWLNPEDKQRSQYFDRQLAKQYHASKLLIKELPIKGELSTVKEQFPEVETALGILHSLDVVKWQDPFHYRKRASRFNLDRSIENRKRDRQQLKQYFQTKMCRWQYLLQAFGFNEEAIDFKCGICDRCQSSRNF